MLASFFRVFVTSPSMDNFMGAEYREMQVIKGCSSIVNQEVGEVRISNYFCPYYWR